MFNSGQQIGIYTLIKPLGRGGFGEVWLAERRSKFVTTKVAVKLPLDEQIDHEAIKLEAMLWEQASGHPNILPIIDADEYDGQIVIVSEYAPDGSLEQWLKKTGKIPVEKAVEMTVQILDGLEFLHSRRIIHRDLKPANILLQGRTLRLADFGISRALRTTVASRSQNISGTFAYMSPEALDGRRSIQSDIWSVGVNLYRFLTDALPFPQKEPSLLLAAIMMREYEPLPDDMPGEIKRIIANSLAKLPENRYKTAEEMSRDLRRYLRNSFERSGPVVVESAPTEPSPQINDTDATYYQAVNTSIPNEETQPARLDQSVITSPGNEKIEPLQIDRQVIHSLKTEIKTDQSQKLKTGNTTYPNKKYHWLFLGVMSLALVVFMVVILTPKPKPDSVTNSNTNSNTTKCSKFSINFDEYKNPSKALRPCKINGSYGFGNSDGTLMIPAIYDEVTEFEDTSGLAAVKKGKWGYIDSKGIEKIKFSYERAGKFNNGKAKVGVIALGGVTVDIDIDTNGKQILPPTPTPTPFTSIFNSNTAGNTANQNSTGNSNTAYPNVVRDSQGKLTPASGYRWVNKDDPKDFRVELMPGLIKTSTGNLTPAPGYRWVNKEDPKDFRVEPIP